MDVAKIGKIDLFSQISFHKLWHLWFTYMPGQMEVGKLVFTADPGGLPKTKMCSKWSIEIFLAYTHNLWRVWIFAKTEDRDTRSTAVSQQREDQQRRRAAAGECSPPSGRGRSTRTTSPAGCTSAPSAATSCSPGAGTEGTRIHLKCHFAAPPSMRTSPPGQHSPTPFIRTPSLRLKRRKEL